jgi:hypothetical protein
MQSFYLMSITPNESISLGELVLLGANLPCLAGGYRSIDSGPSREGPFHLAGRVPALLRAKDTGHPRQQFGRGQPSIFNRDQNQTSMLGNSLNQLFFLNITLALVQFLAKLPHVPTQDLACTVRYIIP